MSGRFAGSKSLDERRRRRIAADETGSNTATDASEESRPLPSRSPSGQFPLRRIISRAHWKLAIVLFGAACVAATVLAIGHLPVVASGKYGPGLKQLASNHAAGLVTVYLGCLLLSSAQLSWLIRWARSRSLRDFRGRYRIWWWAAAGLAIAGFAILTNLPAAVTATVVWATKWPPVLGSHVVYELAPAFTAMILLFPGLQRDMRGCRTSRTFLFLATLILLAAGGTTIAGDSFASLLNQAGGKITPPLAIQGLWLAGGVSLLGAFLFHARHVVYESVEPPELPRRASKQSKEKVAKPAKVSKPTKETAEATAKSDSQQPEPKASTASIQKAAPPQPKTASQERTDNPVPKSEPTKPTASDAPAAPAQTRDDRWAEIGTIEVDGRVIRLDGPEDPMKGLSKRERRKVRKAIKDRQRTGVEEY